METGELLFNLLMDISDYVEFPNGIGVDIKKMDSTSRSLPYFEHFFLFGYLTAKGIPSSQHMNVSTSAVKNVERHLPENPWLHLKDIHSIARETIIDYADRWIMYDELFS